MNVTPRKSSKVVNAFLRSKSTIQADMLDDVAANLRRKNRSGSMVEMVHCLRKALSGNRLFQYEKEGKNFYETKEARRSRCGLSKYASVSEFINATEAESSLV